jgi:hypothetical protein
MNTLRHQLAFFIMVLVLAFTASNTAFAQPSGDGNVHIIVTVEPHKGAEAPEVTRADVMVYEGKNRDQVTDWIPAQGDHAGLEYFVMIDDASGQVLATQFTDIKNFISSLPPTAKVGVAYMQNGTAHIEQDLTADHALASKALRLPLGYATANSSPYFSLTDLTKKWQPDGNRREVLMVTNGFDPYYGAGDTLDPYLSAAIDACQRGGILVSAIYAPAAGHRGHSYWLNYWGQIYLSKLTEETGGEGYYIGFMGPSPDFAPYLNEEADRLTHQYLLTFIAQPEKKARMHAVKVRTELHNVDLVAPNAVWVPASE